MDLQTLTYIVVGLTFSLYIGIAIWARAGTTGEYYAAGRGIHPVANGMATAADWMSAASFISMAGLIAFKGYDASIFLMGWTGGYVLLALCLAPYLRKFGKFTVPDFIGDRFYSRTARLVAVARRDEPRAVLLGDWLPKPYILCEGFLIFDRTPNNPITRHRSLRPLLLLNTVRSGSP